MIFETGVPVYAPRRAIRGNYLEMKGAHSPVPTDAPGVRYRQTPDPSPSIARIDEDLIEERVRR